VCLSSFPVVDGYRVACFFFLSIFSVFHVGSGLRRD
jgi:hypothetical protein